jgi:plasmid maintenance system killer protein
MNIHLSLRAIEELAAAPLPVQKAFIKQINFLVRNLHHPGLHAKKYDEAQDIWQARINQDWRFYFTIANDTYRIRELKPHPK